MYDVTRLTFNKYISKTTLNGYQRHNNSKFPRGVIVVCSILCEFDMQHVYLYALGVFFSNSKSTNIKRKNSCSIVNHVHGCLKSVQLINELEILKINFLLSS